MESATTAVAVSDRWPRVLELACRLTVSLPVPAFKVGDWLHLRPRSVLDTQWKTGTDVPLRVNGTVVAWCEFEVVGQRLAVRVTELA